jgi:hypothetical protein
VLCPLVTGALASRSCCGTQAVLRGEVVPGAGVQLQPHAGDTANSAGRGFAAHHLKALVSTRVIDGQAWIPAMYITSLHARARPLTVGQQLAQQSCEQLVLVHPSRR